MELTIVEARMSITIEELAARLMAQEAEMAELRHEVQELRRENDRLREPLNVAVPPEIDRRHVAQERTNRRQVLGGGLKLAAGALGAGMLLVRETEQASADADHTSTLFNETNASYAIYAAATRSNAAGIRAKSDAGTGIVGEGASNGVTGRSSSSAASGVYGENTSGGFGVAGSTQSGFDTNPFTVRAGLFGRNTGAGPGAFGFNTSGTGDGVFGHGLVGVRGVSAGGAGVGIRGDGPTGVHGVSTTGEGVVGDGASNGVTGRSTNENASGVYGEGAGNGVSGRTPHAGRSGVYGENTGGGHGVAGSTTSARDANLFTARAGVFGRNAGDGPAVLGLNTSGNGDGVVGKGSTGVAGYGLGLGVFGRSTGEAGAGVRGESAATGNGVLGESSAPGSADPLQAFAGVAGRNHGSGPGVLGHNTSGTGDGIFGFGRVGVRGVTSDANGSAVQGDGVGVATGVRGSSESGYGAVLSGGRAQLRLIPRGIVGAPKSGYHQRGELFLDRNCALFICIATGTPGTWKRVQLS
jgi:hypothetical protein